jgi:uncharacterized protein YukJ
MALRNYGVLAGRVLDTRAEGGTGTPHFQVRVRGGATEWRVAVNVLSQQAPSDCSTARTRPSTTTRS